MRISVRFCKMLKQIGNLVDEMVGHQSYYSFFLTCEIDGESAMEFGS